MNTKHWNWIQGLALTALLPFFAACSSEGDELLQSEEKQGKHYPCGYGRK